MTDRWLGGYDSERGPLLVGPATAREQLLEGTASFADIDGDGDLDLFTCGFSADVPEEPAMMASDTGFGPFEGPPGEGIYIYTQEGGEGRDRKH